MMDKNRDKTREEFSPLLDGELTPEERAAIEAELAEDADLLRELESLKRVDALYQGLPAHPAPDVLEGRIRKAIHPEPVRFPRRRLSRRAVWPALAGAAVFLVFGAMLVKLQTLPMDRMRTAKLDEAPEQVAPLAEKKAELEGAARGRAVGDAILAEQAAEEAPGARELGAMPTDEDGEGREDWAYHSRLRGAAQRVADEDGDGVASDTRDALEALGYVGGKDEGGEAPSRMEFDRDVGRPAEKRIEEESLVPDRQRPLRAMASAGRESALKPSVSSGQPAPEVMAEPVARPADGERGDETAKGAFASGPVFGGGRAGGTVADQEDAMAVEYDHSVSPSADENLAAVSDGKTALSEAEEIPSDDSTLAVRGGAPAPVRLVRELSEAVSIEEGTTGSEATQPASSKPRPPRTIIKAGRTLLPRDKEWVQEGYAEQKTRSLNRDSRRWKSLVKKDDSLKELLELREAVVFCVKDAWHRLEPAPKPKRKATGTPETEPSSAPEAQAAP